MQRMMEIYEERKRLYWYGDCVQGAKIVHHETTVAQEAAEKLAGYTKRELAIVLRRITSDRELARVMDRYKAEGATEISKNDLYVLVHDLYVEKKVKHYAEELGCTQWDSCILCPIGGRIFIRELWNYAMGPAGQDSNPD